MKCLQKQQILSLGFFLLLLIVLANSNNVITIHKNEYSNFERKDFDLIKSQMLKENKLPDMPDKPPKDIIFIQKELLKTYKLAYQEVNPRFIAIGGKKKKQNSNRVPYSLNREKWQDESKIRPVTAWSNSVYTIKLYWWKKSYLPENAINGNSYWCSAGKHDSNEVIFWASKFSKLTRIHGINIIWAYAPRQFSIEYSTGGNNFIKLFKFRNTVDKGNKGWWKKLVPLMKLKHRSFPDRFNFDQPIFAKKIKILMRGPVNKFFGIYKVEFFVRNWAVMIKNSQKNQCKESCWTVNTRHPKPGSPVEYVDCLKSIATSEHRELFVLSPNGIIRHFNSGLCVVTNHDKSVTIEDCLKAIRGRNDGSAYYIFGADGSIKSLTNKKYCLAIPSKHKIKNYALMGKILATSNLIDDNHEAEKAIDGNKNTYWASNLGAYNVTMHLNFDHYVTANRFSIKWKYIAKEFEVYTMTLEKGWKRLSKIKNNKKRKNSFILNLVNLKAIRIKMYVPLEKYMNQGIYGIYSLNLNSGGIPIKKKKCDKGSIALKTWVIDDQWYYLTSKKLEYIRAYNIISKTIKQLKSIKSIINNEWKTIALMKANAKRLNKMIKESHTKALSILEKIKVFKAVDLKSKKYPQYYRILRKLNYIKTFSTKKSKSIHLGAKMETPAKDCNIIKKIFPKKKSGFYWIKPNCSKKPLRVFCDFSIKDKGVSIYVWNNNQSPNTEISNYSIETFRDIRYLCAKKGLEVINIANKDILNRIKQILKVKGWNLGLPYAIPLGYDYGCDGNLCSGNYNSLNSQDTKAIEEFFSYKINYFDNLKTSTGKLDTIGFGFDNKKPLFFNLKQKQISAIVCSTNKYGSEENPLIQKIRCSDNLINNRYLSLSQHSSITVSCPYFCLDDKDLKLIGTSRYSHDSSVCKAAIHQGLISNLEGGEFTLNIKGKFADFKSSIKNNIESKESNKESHLTFTLTKYKETCPIKINKNQKKRRVFSFIEDSAMFKNNNSTKVAWKYMKKELKRKKLKRKKRLLKLRRKRERKIKLQQMQQTQRTQQTQQQSVTTKQQSATTQQQSSTSQNKNVNKTTNNQTKTVPVKKKKISKKKLRLKKKKERAKMKRKMKKRMKIIKKLKKKNPKSMNKMMNKIKGTRKSNNNSKKKGKSKKCKITTKSAIHFIKLLRNVDKTDFKKFKNFAKKSSHFVKKFRKDYSFKRSPGKLSNHQLRRLYSKLYSYVKDIQNLENRLKIKSRGRLIKRQNIHDTLKEKYFNLKRYLGYTLNYSKNLNEIWQIIDKKSATLKPSNWIIGTQKLKGRVKAILQTSSISVDSYHKPSSFYILRNKRYFDFRLNLDIMSINENLLGIVFRYRDEFNYYAFILNQKKGYKRLIKVSNGRYRKIAELRDGGLFLNDWFKVQIIVKTSNIRVRFGLDKNNLKYSDLPIVFNIDDYELREGTVGLLVNNNNQFYFDKLDVKPISCWTEWSANNKLDIIPHRASIYDEDYKGEIDKKYFVHEPLMTSGGQSLWKYIKEYKLREIVIKQTIEVIDKSSVREPVMLILKNKYIRKGEFSLIFNADKEGIISIVFKYMNRDNFYLFEIGGYQQENKFFRLRKKISGLMKVIKKIDSVEEITDHIMTNESRKLFGYNRDVFYQVRILLEKDHIKVLYSELGKKEIIVFDLKEDEIQYGHVGFGTFLTTAAFDKILLRPVVDIQRMFFTNDEISEADKKQDVFLYEGPKQNIKEESNENKIAIPNKKNKRSWVECLRMITPLERARYCHNEFKSLDSLQIKCEQDFCGVCCKRSVPWVHRNHLYTCKKQCREINNSQSNIGTDAKNRYFDLCIRVENPKTSIYSYCDSNFTKNEDKITCKIDTCRLCCVTTDQMEKMNLGLGLLNNCFERCAKTWKAEK